jgi:hypothetical protein
MGARAVVVADALFVKDMQRLPDPTWRPCFYLLTLGRAVVAPNERNGLRLPSQIAIDRPQTVRRTKVSGVIGELDAVTMLQVERTLAVLFGLG